LKNDIAGWQKIFSFTFVQNYKSKAAVIALVITCILIIVSGPAAVLLVGSGAMDKIADLTDCKIEKVYIKNETSCVFDYDGFRNQNPNYSGVRFADTDKTIDELNEEFRTDALTMMLIHITEEEEKYNMVFYRSEGSKIDSMSVDSFAESVSDFFDAFKAVNAGISEDTLDFVNSEVNMSVVDIAEISEDKDAGEFNAVISVSVTIYACVIMMIVLVSSQQIAASIVLEKSSKVIETLLMSAKPLAIIVGKIFGTMAVLVCNMVIILIAGVISSILSAFVASKNMSEAVQVALEALNSASSGGAAPAADMAPVMNADITVGRIIFGVFAVLFTTVLAYVFYSVISGVTGASCSSIEDLSSASSFISMMTVIGVYMVMGCDMLNNNIFTNFTYFFPFSGIYIVPVHYIFGKASLSDLFILWAEVILLTVLLFRFAAKIYHVLIYHKGERLKLKHILSISKSQKGKG
jgi:ABC-2 type transport system permease protein